MKRLSLALLLIVLSVPAAFAEDAALLIPDFKDLDARAKETVNLTLGGALLQSAAALIDSSDPDAAATKRLLAGIRSIQVRSFQFDHDGEYSPTDVNAVRRQLSAPGWSPLVKAHDHKGQDIDVFVHVVNDRPEGIAVVVSEPREFTIVNVVGTINLEDLPRLEKRLNLPHIERQLPMALSLPAQL